MTNTESPPTTSKKDFSNATAQEALKLWTGKTDTLALKNEYRDLFRQLRHWGFFGRACSEFAPFHFQNLQVMQNQSVILFDEPNFPGITTRFRTSLKDTEGVSTLEFCLNDSDGIFPVFHTRFFELFDNGLPTLVMTALQRYTDDDLTFVEKPYVYKVKNRPNKEDEETHIIPPLKEARPERYQQYQNETRKIARLERAIGTDFPLMSAVVAIALAKAKGDRQISIIPYAHQRWVEIDKYSRPEVQVPNVYDPTALRLGFTHREWTLGHGVWILSPEPDDATITIPKPNFQSLSSPLQAIGQRAFSSFSGLFYQPPESS